MEELRNPFLSVNESAEKCLICNKDIRGSDGSSLTSDGWKTVTDLAKKWSSVVLPIDHQYYEYTQVHHRIGGRKTAFGRRHRSANCRPAFGKLSLIDRLKKDNEVDNPSMEATTSTSILSDPPLLSPKSTRSSTGNTKQFQRICVCDVIRPCDSNTYNEGGLGVCEFTSAADRLMDAANAIGETNDLRAAKQRLFILVSGESKDIYSAELRYHRSCYRRFTYKKHESDIDVEKQKNYEDALNDFLKKIELSIVYKSNAYLLNDLLKDWLFFCEEREVSSQINHTWQLIKLVDDRFTDSKARKYVIVYSQYANPCEYSSSTLKGFGLRTDDIRFFTNMIKRSIPVRSEDSPKFPYIVHPNLQVK